MHPHSSRAIDSIRQTLATKKLQRTQRCGAVGMQHTHEVTSRGISMLHAGKANKPMRPQTAAEEVTVTRSTARLAEARPPAMPLTMYTAGTARVGTKRTRSRYLPKVQRHVLMQNSWIKPACQSLLLGRRRIGGPIAWMGERVGWVWGGRDPPLISWAPLPLCWSSASPNLPPIPYSGAG